MSENRASVIPPGQRPVLRAFGEEITILLGGEQTRGQFTLFLNVTAPGGGPPPHWHEDEDEVFVPLRGRAEFVLDGRWREVETGSVVFAPAASSTPPETSGTSPWRP